MRTIQRKNICQGTKRTKRYRIGNKLWEQFVHEPLERKWTNYTHNLNIHKLTLIKIKYKNTYFKSQIFSTHLNVTENFGDLVTKQDSEPTH